MVRAPIIRASWKLGISPFLSRLPHALSTPKRTFETPSHALQRCCFSIRATDFSRDQRRHNTLPVHDISSEMIPDNRPCILDVYCCFCLPKAMVSYTPEY